MDTTKTRYNYYHHIIFWVGFFILLNCAYIGIDNYRIVLARNFIIGLFYAFLFYINIYYLIPKYGEKGKLTIYYIAVSAIILAMIPLRIVTDDWLLNGRVPEDLSLIDLFILPGLPDFLNIIISSIVTLLISLSFRRRERKLQAISLQQELKSYRLEARLKLLRTQVNPHFLFNVLNNIYTLAYRNSKEAAPMIAKLSQMMRYMLHSSESKTVSLDKEIAYLKDYIDLQQLKTAKPQKIDFTVAKSNQIISIEPMLFIPFFENSFKHGNVANTEKGWLKSNIKVVDNQLFFSISNSLSNNQTKYKHEASGIGLDNVQKRLELLYPESHELLIEESLEQFSVHLTLKLNQ